MTIYLGLHLYAQREPLIVSHVPRFFTISAAAYSAMLAALLALLCLGKGSSKSALAASGASGGLGGASGSGETGAPVPWAGADGPGGGLVRPSPMERLLPSTERLLPSARTDSGAAQAINAARHQ